MKTLLNNIGKEYSEREALLKRAQTKLNIQTENKIIALADIETWQGRRLGYDILGANIQTILTRQTGKWYIKNRNIFAEIHHDDGVDYIEFRELRERDITKLINKMYNQDKLTRNQINYYTKSLYPYIEGIKT